MKTVYRVRLFTGPTEARKRAAYAADDVLRAFAGTEHVYVDVAADDAHQAMELAVDACGYTSPRFDLGDQVILELHEIHTPDTL